MLKLINIKINDNVIEADYIPENSSLQAHVALNIVTKEESYEVIEDFGGTYGRMAINGLQRTADELKNGKIQKIPEKRIVMWY